MKVFNNRSELPANVQRFINKPKVCGKIGVRGSVVG
jgi:hypothetical protein